MMIPNKEHLQDVINEALRLGYEINITKKYVIIYNNEDLPSRAQFEIIENDIISAVCECLDLLGHVKV